MILLLLFLGVVGVVVVLTYRRYFSYWSRQGIPEVRGFFTNYARSKETLTVWELSNYSSLRSQKFAGMWEMLQPVLYVRDLELIKNIFTRDFEHFVNRRTFPTTNEEDHTKLMLSFREGQHWKDLRNILTPAFSTAKMRRLFLLFDRCAKGFMEYLRERCRGGEPIEFRNAMGKYTMACIAESIFGIDCHAFSAEPPTEFFRMGKRYMDFTPGRVAKLVFCSNYPRIASLLALNVFDAEADAYLTKVVKEVLRSRSRSRSRSTSEPPPVYNDFLEIMRENSEEAGTGGKAGGRALSEHEIVAQCMNFFAAGSDSIETLLIWAAWELGRNPLVQDTLYEEVAGRMEADGGALTFDALMGMEYLDMFISECLRIYPPTQRAERRCTKDYPVPGTKYTIPTGLFLHIPIYPIHHDPEYWPDPERFDPQRFSKENRGKGNQFAFMPFGHGLRQCIAGRYSVVEAKVCIAHLVKNFVIRKCEKTEEKPVYFHLSLKPLNGTWLRLEPRAY